MIPNPYPNIKDLDLSDNKTLSSSKITALLAAKQAQLEDIYDTELEQTASGAVMSFKTAVEKPIRGTFQIDPSLDGVSAVNVIRTGIDIFDQIFEVGDINATTGQNSESTVVIRTKNYISVKPETQYFIWIGDGSDNSTTVRTRFYDKDKNYLGSNQYGGTTVKYNRVFKTPTDCYYMRFTPNASYGTTYNDDISVNYPSTETEYHAYNGITREISLGTTVYGGSVSVSEEGAAKLTETWDGVADLSSLTWTLDVDTHRARTYNLSSIISIPLGGSDIPDALAENFEIVNYSSSLSLGKMTVYSDGSLIAYYDGENTPAGKFAYKLANPTTTDLTDITPIETLEGENNIWADTGSGEIVYMNTIRGIIENNKED